MVVSGGTQPVGRDAVAWAKQCESLGAGVILPTSMDGDGSQAGYDLPFTRAIADAVKVPVVASGSAGKLSDFCDAVAQGEASVLLAASVFHYRLVSIRQVKHYLLEQGVVVFL
ncbi:MAG: HisA/HisF-related TIM barrel protein [Deltaproteobacteria bacterium]|nr:HisA/HisF-related TIM barrel protein [Deltaproteobacteria bacterium]